METKITTGQMKRLQVLYGQLARHTFDGGNGGREARLEWASQLVRRKISSFSELTFEDARHLIDVTQAQLGVKAPATSKRMDRERARRAGTEGRKGSDDSSVTLVGPEELARIQRALDVLGWSQAQFEGWLRSPRSPLGKKSNPSIRTLREANRVWWALKGMAQARGLWKDETAYRRQSA
ncbi:hypothetical protein H7849_11720 [Alloacidobacterium dinghuense]|uniref:DUF1018 domain-containing protein n=1 Tax=Alloacidobacterium dinghuense TaxID=2763107 RepID=A0A7G8BPM3_9BACT|nr:hypothetical protein [Alloacidobacterium dinghuense]QNI34493.1 hypothetical protein H7849_11720 [Alloacidobacterium dinghuense]